MRLVELFNNPSKYTIKRDGDDWDASFDVNGNVFDVRINQIVDDRYYVSFEDSDGEMGLTGRGNAVVVFSTVVNILRTIIKKNPKKIKTLAFAAEKSEASRAPLYSRIAKKAAAELGWTVRRDSSEEQDVFTIDAPDSEYATSNRQVSEVFNHKNTIEYDITPRPNGDGWTAAFTIPGEDGHGEHFEASFDRIGTDAYEVSFRGMLGLMLTGRGNAIKVFATMGNIIRDVVKNNPKQIRTLSFQADKSESSRAPLYGRLAKKAAAEAGWTMRHKDNAGYDEFIIDAPNSDYNLRRKLVRRALS